MSDTSRETSSLWARNKLVSILAIVIVLENLGLLFGFILWRTSVRAPGDPTWTESNVITSVSRGDEIIYALERFHQRTGKYPTQLSELVPKELSSIKPPIAGDGIWGYVSTDSSSYGIGFDSTVPPISWNYTSRDRQWFYIPRKSDD